MARQGGAHHDAPAQGVHEVLLLPQEPDEVVVLRLPQRRHRMVEAALVLLQHLGDGIQLQPLGLRRLKLLVVGAREVPVGRRVWASNCEGEASVRATWAWMGGWFNPPLLGSAGPPHGPKESPSPAPEGSPPLLADHYTGSGKPRRSTVVSQGGPNWMPSASRKRQAYQNLIWGGFKVWRLFRGLQPGRSLENFF